ncbi:DHA2 family efflux MFS transporter permease subunit [Fluoribacter gormanii]|uniref:MFS transporter, DHA2 family, multidrug resistance protein n=1 Tax=Fluoribacter gormanii TaxID=464 RepID=A0A377GMC3_9GAMM|nr:DHA2 family efflux MFS transporter permease subunit [Fluoribacter gormanii]KTD05732.1 multidrug efflux system protein [Fluoribacter gormanii]MCW8442484.1 DHA2 family efflux MFS transporter permease subunit [Fluoribacter gormanii]MCW8470971.1 DHA2 family efflux MFS transporter permease subunit [Fluoribacter gormanii]SIQ61880.1 MFS transporter, DHA2 family, multidrug resistance protein [Fluoribacter gormanii]STO25908.1 Multidrug resistance protein B [Fluoribacter gormanii]
MAEHLPLVGSRLTLMTISLSLAIFMNVLDISIANVAIPTIAGDLGVSPDNGTWVITSFAVSQAIMLPLTGWLAKRFGEVRLFIFSTTLFTIASVLCGLSMSLEMLVFFRVIQGAVSGPMIPLSQSILLANYPPEKRGLATGIWTMTAIVGPIFGPILGGVITDNYTWPWIFYINVPVGIFSVLFTLITLSGRETPITKLPIDLIGLLLLSIGVGCLQILLDKGHDLDWFHSPFIVTLAIVSTVTLSFLIIWLLTQKHPIIDLYLFTNRNFSIGTMSLTLGFMVYFSTVVIFPLWLQTQMGYTPTWAGFAVAPVGILPFFLTPIVGNYMGKFDLRIIISLGFIVFAGTCIWQSTFYTEMSFIQLIRPRFIQGIGLAFFFTPLIVLILAELPPDRLASASGLVNFCRILGSSFGTSISVTLWNHREALHQSHLVEQITAYNPLLQQSLNQLHSLGITGLKGFGVLYATIINQAFMLATNDIFRLAAWIFIFLLAMIWLAQPTFVRSSVKFAAE